MKSILLNEIERSNAVTSRLVELKKGSNEYDGDVEELNSTIFRQAFDIKIGKASGTVFPDEITLTGHFGYKDSITPLDQDNIKLAANFPYFNGGDITVPFNNPNISFLWFAIRSDQPIKTKYQDVVDLENEGILGTSEDLIGIPILVGEYYFYITNYPTIQINSLKFKNT